MNIIVIGAGNWGLTLANLFSKQNDVIIWTKTQEDAQKIKNGEKSVATLNITLNKEIIIEKKFSRKIDSNDIILIAVPSRKIEEIANELKKHGIKNNIILNASKGVESATLKTIQEIFTSCLPDVRFANLSGPTISKEIAEGIPAKAVLASKDLTVLFTLQKILQNDLLKFEFSRDVRGIELASAMKGLIAVAVGVADGLGFKANIFGLIMTYGLKEFERIMKFLGVNTNTVYGIAGIGDLITTSISPNSRNRKFGKLLAQGYSTEEALKKVGMEVEGVSMAKTIRKLSKFNLYIPLVNFVASIIFDDVKNIREELIKTLNEIT
jgi:glycerol-3-phosphate dehydrogenase (NAD(P)+)